MASSNPNRLQEYSDWLSYESVIEDAEAERIHRWMSTKMQLAPPEVSVHEFAPGVPIGGRYSVNAAIAVGFELAYEDIDSGLWLCFPIIKFEGDDRHFIARRIDWKADMFEPNSGLTLIDDDELEMFGVALPIEPRIMIESGWSLVVIGQQFAQDMKASKVVCSDDVQVVRISNSSYSIGLATVEMFERYREDICN